MVNGGGEGWGGDGGDSEASRPTPRLWEKHVGGYMAGKLQVMVRFGDKKHPLQTCLQQLGEAWQVPGRQEAAGLGLGRGQRPPGVV